MRLRFPAVGTGIVCAGILAMLALAGPALAAPYHLRAGDVVEVTVAGLPQYGQRATVQLDGTITVPIIGTIEVEGATIAEVRDRIQSAFGSRLLTVYGSDGRELTRAIERNDVAASIAQYAPIWVSGDVAQPGEKTFRPHMTVRQAIASAGGLRAVIATQSGPSYDVIGLQSEYISGWLALAGDAARAWRLRTELAEAGEFDASALPPAPLGEDALSRILDTEKQIFHLRQQGFEREKKFLQQSVTLAQDQIAALAERLEKAKQGEADDAAELERTQALLNKGSITMGRVVDARRALLYSSTRRLDTESELMQVRTQLNEARRLLEKLDDERRLEIQQELQAAQLKLAEERSRLEGLRAKLEAAGIAVPRPSGEEPMPEITIIRRGEERSLTLKAGYEDEIQPGDVVQVTLRYAQVSAGTELDRPDPSRYAARGAR